MARIAWEEDTALAPSARELWDFCHANDLAAPPPAGLLVFIERAALEALHAYLAHDTGREHGGVLVGQPYQDPRSGQLYTVIHTAIPAQASQGTPVHLQFTPQTWDFISGIIDENFPHLAVVGWYHSHPGLGVFMSGTDCATQRAFYANPWNVAVVVDPLARRTGWFAGAACRPLKARQVIAYQPPGPSQGAAPGAALLEPAPANLSWLLPLALCGAAALLTLWRFSQAPGA